VRLARCLSTFMFQSMSPPWSSSSLAGAAVSVRAATLARNITVWVGATVPWFQSTRPRGARPVNRREITGVQLFQSTRPRGARRPYFKISGTSQMFQSTRPRGARRPRPRDSMRPVRVSIHAPTWGATLFFFQVLVASTFQSTRPRGARPASLMNPTSPTEFQSTRPRGARLHQVVNLFRI
jgi:hypothetical protein